MNRLTTHLTNRYNSNREAFMRHIENIYVTNKYIMNRTQYGINILGVRSNDKDTSLFNDTCIYFAYDGKDTVLYICDFTTDPSSDYLKKPLNNKGCAILKEGQYRNMWTLGNHKGKADHPALIQTGICTVYRDNNKNGDLNYNGIQESGLFGINCHRASAFKILERIGLWSAGCQVFANAKDLTKLLTLCKTDIATNKVKSFTYTLVHE